MFLVLCLLESAARQRVLAGELSREANFTLALPLEPHRFTTVDAFPGLRFDSATALVSPPGDSNRLFIVEQSGRIHVITNLNTPNTTLFLDISSQVRAGGEAGLLGLAFHPGYPTNRYFYLFYTLGTTTSAGAGLHDRLARFEISPTNPNQALPDSEVPLITQLDEAENHNGGDLHFGPDGYLYVSLGDEGGAGGGYGNTQRIDQDFFSGILRIDVDQRAGSLPPNPHPASSTNYSVPADNPFVGVTSFNSSTVQPNQVRTEFWAVGLRNPWRFSFDSLTGRLYCGDAGQSSREEIDLIVRGGNYGWNYREGTVPYSGSPPDGVTFVEPIIDYGRSSGGCVIGGVVYRGTKIPSLSGEYIFGDYISGSIWALRLDGGTNAMNFRQLASRSNVRAFGQDPANQDVLMTSDSGAIYRLVLQDDVETPLPATLDATGAFADLATLQPQPGIVPYDLNVPFWSDHARKTRWFSVPDTGQFMGFRSNENWSFPTGAVWIKHFELELTNGVPQSARRLETRFLVRNSGGVYGITYRWDDAQANAFLVPTEGMDEAFLIHDGATIRTQIWHYPARAECSSCHTPASGFALGFNTGQLNRDHGYGGTLTNQILALSQMRYFSNSVTAVDGLLSYASATVETVPVEHRVRSYLAANCVQCHQPDGSGGGYWDARFTTPLPNAGIINGALINSQGNPDAKVIKPGSLEDSTLFKRVSELGSLHMPPLATTELNHEAIDLLARWITNGLVALDLRLPAANLAYTEGTGPVILDPGATIATASATSLAGGSLRVEFDQDGLTEDRLAVRNVGDAIGEIGGLGNVVRYGDTAIGIVTGGMSGFEPLVVTFSANVTTDAAQALLRNVTYENVSTTPAILTRTLRVTIADATASNRAESTMTISVQGVPEAPVLAWARPEAIVYGTALTASELNPTANVPGNFIFDPPSGQVLPFGNHQLLLATFVPADIANFTMTTITNLIDVEKAPLVVTADNKSKVYGQANPPLSASYTGFVNGQTAADLDTPVSLSTTATVSSPVGGYPIIASGAADANYSIGFVEGALTIERAALVISADNKSKVYGQNNPPLSASYSGFVNGRTAADLDTPVSLSTTATASSPVGGYPIIASGAADANYSISFVEGALTIARAQLVITADNKSKVYGQSNPPLSASYSGFVNGQTAADLDTPVSLGTTATASSLVGGYPIIASGAANANYSISFVEGALTIERAPLVITADNKSKVYGQNNPPLSASYTGFVNGRTAADLDTPVSLSTTATASSPVGGYPIIASGAADANYSIDFVEGQLVVESNAVIQSITLDFDGPVRILFTGFSGRLYRVEGSNDLLTWGTLLTVQADTNGIGEFVHARSGSENYSARFYRFAWP